MLGSISLKSIPYLIIPMKLDEIEILNFLRAL